MDFPKSLLPHLAGEGYRVTSPIDRRNNCIGWAVGDPKNWWWPLGGHWPENAAREETLASFSSALVILGYESCVSPALEEGFEKVAVYALGDIPTHAARQLSTGLWTSKLGKSVDIEHTLAGLEGPLYGRAVKIFRRRRLNEVAP